MERFGSQEWTLIDTEHEEIGDLVILNSFAADGDRDTHQQDLQNLQSASMPALAGITATCIMLYDTV